MRYDLSADGDVLDRSILHDLTNAPGEDAIDGIKVDVAATSTSADPAGSG